MKRTADEEEPHDKDTGQHDSLQYRAITIAFDQLPLHKKRELMPELLKSARVVHGQFLDPVSNKFRAWLTRGRIKHFTEEDVEKLWGLWCHVKKTSTSSYSFYLDENFNGELAGMYHSINQNFETIPCEFNLSHDRENDRNMVQLPREEYFKWLLDNTYPENVKLSELSVGVFYTFPNLKCDDDDCCDMTIESLEFHHQWERDFKDMSWCDICKTIFETRLACPRCPQVPKDK